MRCDPFPLLAKLARYPDEDYLDRIEAALGNDPACEPLRAFAAAVATEPVKRLQELYTKTFDLNPVCAPELGWHLFGENYERGAFLVNVRQELCRHDIPIGTELPDHLALALQLVSRMSAEDAEYFVVACFAPALHTMLHRLPQENVFRLLLLGIREALERTFPCASEIETPVNLTVLNEGAME